MHTRTTTAALLTAALLTTGCSSDNGSSAPEPSPTASETPKEQFINAVRNTEWPSWDDKRPGDDELTEYPPQWCTELEAGHSVAYLFDMTDGAGLYPVGMDWGTEESDANKLLVLGVTAYCPEHREQVTRELRADGGY